MHPVAKAKITAANDSRMLEGAERAAEIVRLRARNLTWRSVAQEVKLTEGRCKNIWTRELQRFRDEAEIGVADHVDAQLLIWDERLAQLQADLIDARTLPMPSKIAHVSKIETAIARIEQMRIDLLGLKAPELHAHLHGSSETGVDVPLETLEAMGDDQLAAALEGQRKLRSVAVEVEEKVDPEYADEDDGAPAEVVIEDPGPRAVVATFEGEEPDGCE